MVGAIIGVVAIVLMCVASVFAKKMCTRRKKQEEQVLTGIGAQHQEDHIFVEDGMLIPEQAAPLAGPSAQDLDLMRVGSLAPPLPPVPDHGVLAPSRPQTATSTASPGLIDLQIAASSHAGPGADLVAPDQSPSNQRWEVRTDQGWMPWAPGAEFTGAAGEEVEYTLGRFRYKAVFDSTSSGRQINLQTNKERILRRTVSF